jgi:hypothetical protein
MSTNPIVIQSTKNAGLALGLGLFFGPIGLLYSSIAGAIIMFLVGIPVVIFTAGFGLLFTQPVCAIWGFVAANAYNKKLLEGQTKAGA